MARKIQIGDSDGNPAYVLTHYDAIDGNAKALPMVDEIDDVHELRFTSTDGLIVDGIALDVLIEMSGFYTATQVDKLLEDSNTLASPDGAKWIQTIDNEGKVTWKKK